MSRLTNKKLVDLKYGEFISIPKEEYRKQVHEAPTYKEIYTKLGHIEDLMEKYEIDSIENLEHILQVLNMLEIKSQAEYLKELGCPLDVVFKALKEGIVVKQGIIKVVYLYFIDDDWFFKLYQSLNDSYYRVKLKDYGKNWWLKNETSI